MPHGLKKYMDLKLLPHIHMKVGQGISLSTAHCWLHLEGFQYTTHKKGLYFDGDDRPDVIEYCQNVFLPAIKAYKPHLVQYTVSGVDNEQHLPRNHYVEHRLIFMPQDEMTSQANDISKKTWVFENQYQLCKNGPGQGLHQSDTITLTVGWLKQGSQTLEYGKNYNRYWNGELFVKQVSLKSHLAQ